MISYKFKLKPTKQIIQKIDETLEICRKTYNQALAERIFTYKTFKKSLTYNQQSAILAQYKIDEQRTVYSKILQNVLKRLDKSYKNFFSRGGFPRFKGTGQYSSFRLEQSGFKIENNYIELSKIGKIKFVKHREIQGNVKEIQIVKNGSKFYLIVTTDFTRNITSSNECDIGIDLGIKDFVTLNTGEKFNKLNNNLLKKLIKNIDTRLKKIKKLQIELSAKKKFSKKFKELKSKIGNEHEKIKNQRKDTLHKISLNLVMRFKDIYVEDLNIKEMTKKGKKVNKMSKNSVTSMRRNILLSGFGQFIEILVDKAESAGNKVVKIDPRYSSQICPQCGLHKKKELSERIHSCSCGLVIDRDVAAAMNILNWGLVGVPKSVKLLYKQLSYLEAST